jgi:uroporphyrinogen decarboxylase
MNSRERITKAINFGDTDRLPIDLAGMRSTGIAAFALYNLQKYILENFEIRPDKLESIKIYDTGQMLGWVPDWVRKFFGIDVISIESFGRNPDQSGWHKWEPRQGQRFLIPAGFNPELNTDGSWIEKDENSKIIRRMPPNGYYFDAVVSPLQETEVIPVKEFNPPDSYTDEELRYFQKRAGWLWENTDYAILGSFFGGNLFDLNIGGMVNWMCMVASEPERAKEYVEKVCDAMIRRAKLVKEAVGNKVFALVIGNDMGTQRGEFYSPETFRKVNAPAYKRFCSWIHENTDFKVFLHSCGSIYNYIETLIDCGIDILNPVQISAKNMDPEKLKEKFGGRIVFWGGGCDTQYVLPFGTPQEVREEVKKRIEVFAPGGGFVFCPVHNILAEVPSENIVAMMETVQEYGKY